MASLKVNTNASKNRRVQILDIQNKALILHKEEDKSVFRNCFEFEHF